MVIASSIRAKARTAVPAAASLYRELGSHAQPQRYVSRRTSHMISKPASLNQATSRQDVFDGTGAEQIVPVSPPVPQGSSSSPRLEISRQFEQGELNAAWKEFASSDAESLRSLGTQLGEAAAALVRLGPDGAAYVLQCVGRAAFYGTLFGVGSRFIGGLTAAQRRRAKSTPESYAQAMRRAEETGRVLLSDWRNIAAGVYKVPWEARLGSTWNSPSLVVQQIGRAVSLYQHVSKMAPSKTADTSVWLEGKMYPDYYKQTFHYQEDGWMSSKSADLYDLSTETLFGGRQDAMQRLTLVALCNFLRSPDMRAVKNPRVVEVAAGTGRFATFVRDNFPQIDYTVSDLSPFYLQKARESMTAWDTATRTSRSSRSGKTQFVQAQAEDLPLEDSSVDVLFAIYLFHELPPQARSDAIAEAARVLRPGGMFIMTDSIQLGDRPNLDATLGQFSKFNEPWYDTYVKEDFAHMVTKGDMFEAKTMEVCSVTKMMSFLRTAKR